MENELSHNGHLSRSDWMRVTFEQYEGPLMRYATHLTGDVERARDVVQETFLRLAGQEPGEINSHLAPWLFTVCRSRALDLFRKENRLKSLTEFEIESCPSEEPSPAAAIEREETASQVLDAIATLSSNQQEVVRLKFQHGLSYQEISGVTNLSVTNVGFLLHTAIKRLRRRLRTEPDLKRKH